MLQWSGFRGTMAENGRAFLTLCQSITNLPPYPINKPYRVIYNNSGCWGFIEINPFIADQIRFFFNVDGNGTCVKAGDFIVIPGGCVEWITEC
jgi:hypothetical protein